MNDNSTDALNGPNVQKLDQILAAVQQLDARVEQVETTVDERLRETRPIWEAIQIQVLELKESVHTQVSELKESVQAQLGELKESQQSFRTEVEKSFRLLDRRMEMYADMVARVHAYQRDLEDRVDEFAKRLT